MKKLLMALSLFLPVIINAQFNGSIEFKYTKEKDTTNNVYHVKDKLVKLDNFNRKTGALEGSFIFDLGTNTIKWINPKRKVWGEHKSETPPIIKGKCEVAKGTNSKTIQGVKCTDYIVKNTEENTIITYWIGNDKFNFFIPIVKLWNGKDKQRVYFNQITGLPEGSMPMLSEEKQLSDGKVMTRLEVTKINKKTPDDASMKIPEEYTKFDK